MYKATIVIPNINGKGWLKDSIESVYAQTEQNFRLIVVDNGSTDESLEQARSYCSRENFTLIENGTNTGFSHAVNQGIALADSEYVVLFNNDAFAEPQWLEELIRTAETDPKIFAVQSLMIRHFDRELADDAGDYVTWMGFACKTGDGRRASRYTRQKRIFSACGGAALYRKSILDEIGNFDENFFAYFEDVDLSWRANNAGYKNLLCPTAKCYHICGASTGAVKYNAFKSQQSGRNSILLPLKAIAAAQQCAALLVMHSNKKQGVSGRARLADSSDIWDMARSVLMMGRAKNDGKIYLSHEKNSYARPQQTVLLHIDDVEVEGVKTARAVFDGYTDKKDADFIEERRVRTAETRQDTRSAILNVLSESRLGSMPSNELRAAVLREIGCSDSTYNRVYSELVKSGEIAKHQINQGGNVRSWFTAMPYRGETSDKVAKL